MFKVVRIIFIVAVAAVLATTAAVYTPAQHAKAASLQCLTLPEEGVWNNLDPNTRSITQIQMTQICNDTIDPDNPDAPAPPPWYVTIFGKCHPSDCAWGQAAGNIVNGWIYTFYDPGFAHKDVWIKLYPSQGQNLLLVHVDTHFTDQSGRADYSTDDWFSRVCVIFSQGTCWD